MNFLFIRLLNVTKNKYGRWSFCCPEYMPMATHFRLLMGLRGFSRLENQNHQTKPNVDL